MIHFVAEKEELLGRVRQFLRYLNENRRYTVVIKRYYPKRSTGKRSQNTHIHGHATQIGDYAGYYKGEIIRMAQEDAITKGYPTKLDLSDRVIPVPEQELDSLGANILIEQLHEMAGKLGLDLIEYPEGR